jgi:hypothetical protein
MQLRTWLTTKQVTTLDYSLATRLVTRTSSPSTVSSTNSTDSSLLGVAVG